MKYLLALLVMFSSTVYAEDDLCDAVAALTYVMATDYYENNELSYYMYQKAETVLEVSIIDIMVETKAEPIHLAYVMREVCINDRQLIKETISISL